MSRNRILITGPPGCGKTTLIKGVIEKLQSKQIFCEGFFTEEVRVNGVRRGFDVIIVNSNSRYPLAYISNIRGENMGPSVGRYAVNLASFDSALQKMFINNDEDLSSKVLIIDEIGKMELFSEYFKTTVTKLFRNKSNIILATIPVERKRLPFVEQLLMSPSIELITVNVGNRDLLVDELCQRMSELYLSNKK